MTKQISQFAKIGALSAFHHEEDIEPRDLDITVFGVTTKTSHEFDPPIKMDDVGYLAGMFYAPEKEDGDFEIGTVSPPIFAGKNKPPKAENDHATQPAGTPDPEGESEDGIYFVQDYHMLDMAHPSFDKYGEHTETCAASGRKIAKGEPVMLLPGTGGFKEHQRMMITLCTLIADQQSGDYS